MTIAIAEESTTAIPEYASVPIAFTVDCVLNVTNRDDDSGRFELSERRLNVPYEKDYDAIAGEGPLQWECRFDLSQWALFTARVANRVGDLRHKPLVSVPDEDQGTDEGAPGTKD